MDVFADDAVRLRRGPGDVAGHLRIVVRDALGAEAERGGIGVAGLHLKARPVDGAAVEARRRAGLEAASAQAELLQGFAEQDGGGFAGASGGILLLAAVDQAVEEGAGRDDDGLRRRRCGRRGGGCPGLAATSSLVVESLGRTAESGCPHVEHPRLSAAERREPNADELLPRSRSATSACLIFRFGCDSSTSRIFRR